jgi:putative peptidoglycan lipid II flippase
MAEDSSTLSDSPPPAPPAAHRDRFVRHANLMSILTIISRFAGLIRDKTCSYFVGIGTEWSAFWMGFQLPNLFRRIFGEGALTAIFVPIYTRTLEIDGKEAANRLASATCTLLVCVLGLITIAGEAVAIPLAFLAHEPNNRLAAALTAIMLPYCISVCLVAVLGAIGSVHEKFAEQSISPIILNGFWAAGAALPVVFAALFHDRPPDVATRTFWMAGAILLAGVVQVWLMRPVLIRGGIKLQYLLDLRHPGVREIIQAMLPMMLGMSAVQLNVYMDSQIAWWLSPDGHGGRAEFTLLGLKVPTAMGPGANAILSVAQRIYMLPVGIFGVSLATAIFPLLTRAASRAAQTAGGPVSSQPRLAGMLAYRSTGSLGDLTEFKRLLVAGLNKTFFLSFPASAGMIIIAHPLITLIYMGGKTGPAEVDRAYWASIWFCVGIWAFEAQMVLLRAFYALRDTKTPMKVAVAMIGLNFALNLTLVWFLREGGIALSTTIAASIQCFVLLAILRKRVGRLGLAVLRVSIIKGLIATAIMVEACWATTGILERVFATAGLAGATRTTQVWIMALVRLPVILVVAAVVFAAMAWLLGMPELKDMPLIGRWLRSAGNAEKK